MNKRVTEKRGTRLGFNLRSLRMYVSGIWCIYYTLKGIYTPFPIHGTMSILRGIAPTDG